METEAIMTESKLKLDEMPGQDLEQEPLLAIMGRFYPFSGSGIPYADTTLVIEEIQNHSTGEEDGGTGLIVWDGSLLLARYLEKKPALVRNKTVLELGSGCGLVGISCSILGAEKVVMTDLQYALPLMEKNVNVNRSSHKMTEGDGERITCKQCNWLQPPPIYELMPTDKCPDVILVADCVWLAPLVDPLLRTLHKYADSSTKVIITYQQRGRDVHDEFWGGLHELFEVLTVNPEKTIGLKKPDVFYLLECEKKR